MANTPLIGIRVHPDLTAAAREGVGQPDIPLAVLVRAGLALLAGAPSVKEALTLARTRPGPKSQETTTP